MEEYGESCSTGFDKTYRYLKLHGSIDFGFIELRKDSSFGVAD